jgi:hypothetical protein
MRGSALASMTYESNSLHAKTVLPLFCHFYGPKINGFSVLFDSAFFRDVLFDAAANLISNGKTW